jgi:hypothetical protein
MHSIFTEWKWHFERIRRGFDAPEALLFYKTHLTALTFGISWHFSLKEITFVNQKSEKKLRANTCVLANKFVEECFSDFNLLLGQILKFKLFSLIFYGLDYL